MKRLFQFISIVLLLMVNGSVFAERVVVNNVPYINQVHDMDSTKFLGNNACGPTSVVMLTSFYHLQPGNPSAFLGYWVYNSYGDLWRDNSNNNYSERSAKDWNGSILNSQNPHSVYGAHGFIVSERANGNWDAGMDELENYLRNHGLTLRSSINAQAVVYNNNQGYYQTIINNIKAGLPLVAHSYIGSSGHYLLIVGYDTGENGLEQNVVVHDPFGDANVNWFSTVGDANYKTYPIQGNGRAGGADVNVRIDRIIPVYPVGIYTQFPGFHANNTSQPFVTTFKKHSPKIGYPFSDNGGGVNVHEWKGTINTACSVLVQNFQGDLNAPHFGADGQSAIILNDLDLPVVANLVKEGMWGYYKEHDGPGFLGVPTTEEIQRPYANSPYAKVGDFVSPNPENTSSYRLMTVQKFRLRETDPNKRVLLDRKTLVYNPELANIPGAKTVERFPVGVFSIGADCVDEDTGCKKSEGGIQWYCSTIEHPEKEMPWPMAGVTSPTGEWITKAGTYIFYYYDSSGAKKGGYPVPIFEGNKQFAGWEPEENPTPSKPYTFTSAKTCASVQTGSPWTASESKSSFLVSDGGVYSWVELADLREAVTVKWQWFQNGSLVKECVGLTDNPKDHGASCSHEWYRLYNKLDITSSGNYHVKVFVNGTLCSTNSFGVYTQAPSESNYLLGPPLDLRVDKVGTNLIRLVWGAGYNAGYYNVYRDGSTSAFTASGTFFEDRGIYDGTTHTYRVESRHPYATSFPSAEISATTLTIESFQANFSPSVSSGVAPLTVAFNNTSTGDPTAILYDFKDGGFSTEYNPVHTFTNPGTYGVWLETYRYGRRSEITKTITVLAPPTFNLGVPTEVSASKNFGNKVVITWVASESAQSYNVYRDGISLANVTGLSYTDNAVAIGKTYSYQITAVNGAYESTKSVIDFGFVQDFLNGLGSYSFHISVGNINGSNLSELAFVQIGKENGKPQVVVYDGDTLTELSRINYFQANCEPRGISNYGNLDNAGGPEIGLLVFDYGDSSVKLEIRDALTGALFFGTGSKLSKPEGVLQTEATDTEVKLAWQGIEGALSYNVYRDGVLVGNVAGLSFTDNTVSPDTMYRYTIQAVRNSNVSDQSIALTVVTASIAKYPPNLFSGHVYFTDTLLKVAFAGYSPSLNQPVLYIMEVATGKMVSEIPYLSAGFSPLGISKYVIDNKTYVAILAQKQTGGDTQIEIREVSTGILYSGTGDGTILAGPKELAVSEVTTNEATLSWDEVLNASSYRVFRNGVLVGEVQTNSFSDADLDYMTAYRYTVQAVVNNVISDLSSEYLVITASPVACMPSTYIAHEYFTDTSLKIAALGICPENNRPYVYVVDVATGNIIADYAYFGSGYNPQGMSKMIIDGQTYMGVVAYNSTTGDGNIEIRSMQNGLIFTGTPIAVPTGIQAPTVDEYEVVLTWDEVPGAESYDIYRDGVKIGSSSTNSFDDEGVVEGVTYRYKINALSGSRVSGLSGEFLVTTPTVTANPNPQVNPTNPATSTSCMPSTYVDHKYFTENGELKVAALGMCNSNHSPAIYVINANTMVMEKFIPCFSFDHTPLEIVKYVNDGVILFEVLARDEATGENVKETRYLSSGSLK